MRPSGGLRRFRTVHASGEGPVPLVRTVGSGNSPRPVLLRQDGPTAGGATMSSTTPGTAIPEARPVNPRVARALLALLLVDVVAVLAFGIHERNVKAGYQDAFESGGVTSVVEHATARGDAFTEVPGGVSAPYGCYLDDGEVLP